MKFLVVFSAVLALAAARPGYIGVPLGYVAPVSVLPITQYHSQDNLGQYAYGYTAPTSAHAESRLGDVTSGSYSYIDAEGQLQSVTYRADAFTGFRVAGTNIPQAPAVPEASRQAPTPVQDTPEVANAREEHRQAVEAVRARDATIVVSDSGDNSVEQNAQDAAQQDQENAQQAQDAAQQAQDAAQQAQDAAQQDQENAQQDQDAAQQAQDAAQQAQDAIQQEQDNAQLTQDLAQQAQDHANEQQGQAAEQQEQAAERQNQAVAHSVVQLPYIYNYAPLQSIHYIQPYSYIQPAVYGYSLPYLYTNGHPVSDLPQDDSAVARARAEHQAAHQQVRANLQAAGAAV